VLDGANALPLGALVGIVLYAKAPANCSPILL